MARYKLEIEFATETPGEAGLVKEKVASLISQMTEGRRLIILGPDPTCPHGVTDPLDCETCLTAGLENNG